MPVHKLQRTATVFKKKNTYTLYVTREKPYRPVRYIMHGYDTLLHSFYDHYIVDYLSFREWEFDFNVMKIPKGTKEVKLLRINRDLTKLRRRRRRQRQRGHQINNRFNEQKNNSARASRFFVHFFAVPAQLRRKMTKF